MLTDELWLMGIGSFLNDRPSAPSAPMFDLQNNQPTSSSIIFFVFSSTTLKESPNKISVNDKNDDSQRGVGSTELGSRSRDRDGVNFRENPRYQWRVARGTPMARFPTPSTNPPTSKVDGARRPETVSRPHPFL